MTEDRRRGGVDSGHGGLTADALPRPGLDSGAFTPPPRYVDRGLLGLGGMGEVRRVHDAHMDRDVAMKILRREHTGQTELAGRFVAEARRMARLQHPGLLPVFDHGGLDDGRPWYTMPLVPDRQTLRAAMAARTDLGSESAIHSLVSTLRAVCQAVAYAHGQGVVHRDLKPDNVMLGPFNEVWVLDWGSARWVGESIAGGAEVVGTPPYNPPEQRGGVTEPHGCASDVYALGVILYEVVAGHLPSRVDLEALGEGVLAPDLRHAPTDLVEVCRAATARDPAQRLQDAGVLERRIGDWLDGSRRRARAQAIVDGARVLLEKADELATRSRERRSRAAALLEDVLPHHPVERREPAWALDEEADVLEEAATATRAEYVQALRSALNEDASLPAAHEGLSTYHHEQLVEAESRRDGRAVAQAEFMLRVHDRGRYASWLRGVGAVTLVTEPAGAAVSLWRWVKRARRLVPVFERRLGTTPLLAMELPQGSYVLRVDLDGHAPVSYPVRIERNRHWDGVPPGASAAKVIALPSARQLGPDDVYVPAGWFTSGGDEWAPDGLPRRAIWVDGFVVRRFPVSVLEYVSFLNALVARGRGEIAERHVPAERLGVGEASRPVIRIGESGRYEPGPDVLGRVWPDDWPVTLVDWDGAVAWSGELAETSGLPWRLLHDQEWEKAARGVDGRFFPWGDFTDPAWSCVLESHEGLPGRVPRGAFAADESPYGVRDLGGNVRDWCLNAYHRGGPPDGTRVEIVPAERDAFRCIRGGCWSAVSHLCRPAARFASKPEMRLTSLGFRVARSFG